jgi:hypothetical protein
MRLRAASVASSGIGIVCAVGASAQRGKTAVAPESASAPPQGQSRTRAAPAVPFAPGQKLTYDVSSSSDLTAGTTTLEVKERKPSYRSEAYYITADGQDVRALTITPLMPSDNDTGARQLTLWLSDDLLRLPVRLEAQLAVGIFDLTLQSVIR